MKTHYFIATPSGRSRTIQRISTLRRVFKRIKRSAPGAHMVRETVFR